MLKLANHLSYVNLYLKCNVCPLPCFQLLPIIDNFYLVTFKVNDNYLAESLASYKVLLSNHSYMSQLTITSLCFELFDHCSIKCSGELGATFIVSKKKPLQNT